MNIQVAYQNGILSILPFSDYTRCFVMLQKSNSEVIFRRFINLSKGVVNMDDDFGSGQYAVSVYSANGRYSTTISIP